MNDRVSMHPALAAYRHRWIVIARTADVPAGHLFHGRLLGEELAVWRNNAGHINVWENRCPHRGVRLTIGSHLGDQLQCRYHGWRYATGSGGCVHIPAHPNETPPARIGVKVFRALERSGFIWASTEEPSSEPASIAHLPADHHPLRSAIMRAPAEVVAAALLRHAFAPAGGTAQRIDPLTVVVRHATGQETLRWLIQPSTVDTSIVYGVHAATVGGAWLEAAQQLNASLQSLRSTIEAQT
ncbi:MAG: Rieske (2Fe-2S) protein [Betaproteobacteria bacterium]|nr:Rieske (2Fe-2S) protein [Betaproteobacteria bacterium]